MARRRLPFSFRYDGRGFAGAGDAWQFHRGQLHREANVESQDWTWLHPKSGLKVVWHVKRFLDYPAVDTLLTFEDAGAKDTAMIEDVQNLDLKLKHARPGKEYVIHGVHGGRCGADDFMPWKRTLAPAGPLSPTKPRQDHEFQIESGSSNGEAPFFNFETPEDRGVLLALGWTGGWRRASPAPKRNCRPAPA